MRVYTCAVLLLILTCSACNGGSSAPPGASPGSSVEIYAAPVPGGNPPAAALDGLPAPSDLRAVSWDPGDQLVYGFLFAEPWPHAGVTSADPPWLEFTSQYQHQPDPTFDDVAFCLYRFYVLPGTEPVLCTSWDTPPAPLGCYIGLANYQKNAWDWFACTGEDIALPPLAAYIRDDLLTTAVCVLEEGPLRLEWLRFGPDLPPEARITADDDTVYAGQPVSFALHASEDPERAMALYEYDFDGDGEWDYASPDTPDTSHVYDLPGTYTAVGRVTDGPGASDTAEQVIYVSGFTPQQIDGTGFSPSMAIDPTDVPLISYSGGGSYRSLRVATVSDPVDIQGLVLFLEEQDLHTALVLSGATAEIAFGNTKLYYALEIAEDVFDFELVDADKSSGKPAIVTNGEGETSIFYSHLEGDFPLQTAHFTRAYGSFSGFSLEQLDAAEHTGRFCDAVYEGYLTCVYAADEGQSDGRLIFGFYSTIDGWSWITARQNMHRYSSRVALAIDPADHMPRIAYIGDRDGTGTYHDAMYTWYADDDWLAESLEGIAWDCDIALDPDSHPHVVVTTHAVQPTRSLIWYHWHDGAEWHRVFVGESAAGEIDYIELALDSGNTPHFCWTFIADGETQSQLWYATEDL